MSGTSSKVLAGCAIGCVVLLIAAALLGWLGYRWTQGAMQAVEQASADEQELEERHGEVREFHPPLDYGFAKDRFEVFLSVREQLAPERESVAETVAGFAPPGSGAEPASRWRTAGAGMRLAPRILELGRARNRALLDLGMGLGEYTWYYWLGYHAFLGRPPAESELHRSLEERRAAGSNWQVSMGGELEPDGVRWRLRRDILVMLRNLAEDLEADPEKSAWREAVDAEIQAVAADPERLPWQGGLPEVLGEGLEPYRERLEATYSPATNIFELVALE